MTEDDRRLIQQFEDGSIPLDEWDQRAHVSIAFLLQSEHAFDEALARLRNGIRRYNAANGIEESPTSGYNETTTVALFRIIDTVRRTYEPVFPAESAQEFCDLHPELMSKHVLRFFYSPTRRMAPRAKAEFVEPDLAPLPTVGPGN